jgi:hypothetical protein
MQNHAASDAYKAEMAKKAMPEKRVVRAQSREFTENQLAGGTQADRLMDYYKKDPEMAEAFEKNPAAATKLRDALAEKAGAGASEAALIDYGAGLIEDAFGVEAMDVVTGTLEEGEEKAA